MKLNVLIGVAILGLWPVFAGEVTLRSGPERTHLLELYTSEGCSSCPPAEKWLAQLEQSPRLWKEIVPVAFHVNYWDRLGWPDRFASQVFTARQRSYAATWGTSTVYTPGFVLDGREWQERTLESIPPIAGDSGVLTATIRDRQLVTVTYEPPRAGKWEAHLVVLGFGLSSNVKAGENQGRKLLHSFVALAHETRAMSADPARVKFNLPPIKLGDTGLAVWITQSGKLQPVQALGGKL